MAEAADYSALEHLRDGRPIKIRALRPDDRADMLAAIAFVVVDAYTGGASGRSWMHPSGCPGA